MPTVSPISYKNMYQEIKYLRDLDIGKIYRLEMKIAKLEKRLAVKEEPKL